MIWQQLTRRAGHIQTDAHGWRVRFFTIWIGQALSLLGSQVAGFAVIWWMTTTTGSATVLAIGALIDSLPRVFVGPLAGALIDRWDRRRVLIIADGISALAIAALAYLGWANLLQVWHFYALGVVRSICGVFHWLAMQASTSLMVPQEHLSRVQGMNQTLNGVMNIIGPPLGALLIGTLPLYGALSIDLGTALVAIAPLLFVAIPQLAAKAVPDSEGKRSVGKDMREGLSYLWNWAGLRTVVLIAIGLNLVAAPPMVLVPLLVTEHFGGGAAELGALQAAWPVGLVLGGLLLSVWGGFRRKATSMIVGLAATCISMVLVGLAPRSALWLAWIGFFAAGVVNTFVNAPLFALLQTNVKPEMQGRVMATLLSLSGIMMPLGLAVAGPVADRTGIRPWYIIAGIASLLGSIALFADPAVRQLEDEHTDPERAKEIPLSSEGYKPEAV